MDDIITNDIFTDDIIQIKISDGRFLTWIRLTLITRLRHPVIGTPQRSRPGVLIRRRNRPTPSRPRTGQLTRRHRRRRQLRLRIRPTILLQLGLGVLLLLLYIRIIIEELMIENTMSMGMVPHLLGFRVLHAR